MGRVKILNKIEADKIAAGEVVERPASVVKELAENAIDASARFIQINLVKGGQESIEVIDDGLGMSPDDAKLAIQRFATSKITSVDDLEGLHTFGFRGEALPSIGAISKLEMVTRERDAEEGSKIICNGGHVSGPSPVGTPMGTRVTVKDIFFNTPARRKFLKSPASETAHIVGITQKLALVNEEIGFKLTSNSRTALDFPAQMSIKERILSIWGLPLDYKIIHLEYETSMVRVSGWICPPDEHKTHRSYQIFFVNNRYIKSLMVNQAVREGYAPLLPAGKFPMALVYIDLPGNDLDINVHPNKMEVRFVRPGAIFKAVRDSIKKSLHNFGYSMVDPSPHEQPSQERAPQERSFNDDFQVFPRPAAQSFRRPMGGSGYSPPAGKGYSYHRAEPAFHSNNGLSPAPKEETDIYQEIPGLEVETSPVNPPPVRTTDLSAEETSESGKRREFNALAQLRKTYIVGLFGDELWMVDQHTAHERINYEKLAGLGRKDIASQKLLFPIMMELPPTLYNFLLDKKENFEDLGFEIEEFGGNSYLIKAIPHGFSKLENKQTLMEILEDVAGGEPYMNLTAFYERLRANIACKASVRAGDTLNVREMNALVNEMIRMDYSSFCPHGRPVAIKLSKEHIDRMFHRI